MAYPFIQARNYTRANRTTIDLLVIHTMEAPEKPDTAENVAKWFAGPTAPQASAHYCIDDDSIVQCVMDKDVAWHAPGANHNGLGFEHGGTARQTSADWQDAYSEKVLALSATLVAEKCKQYGIPARWLTPADLKAGRRGIAGHADCTVAFGGTHTDPGANFPKEHYLGLVQAQLGAGAALPKEIADPPPVLKVGLSGWEVKRLQRLLDAAGFSPGAVDGSFGAGTQKALMDFQRGRGLSADGIAGADTWHALENVYTGPH